MHLSLFEPGSAKMTVPHIDELKCLWHWTTRCMGDIPLDQWLTNLAQTVTYVSMQFRQFVSGTMNGCSNAPMVCTCDVSEQAEGCIIRHNSDCMDQTSTTQGHLFQGFAKLCCDVSCPHLKSTRQHGNQLLRSDPAGMHRPPGPSPIAWPLYIRQFL